MQANGASLLTSRLKLIPCVVSLVQSPLIWNWPSHLSINLGGRQIQRSCHRILTVASKWPPMIDSLILQLNGLITQLNRPWTSFIELDMRSTQGDNTRNQLGPISKTLRLFKRTKLPRPSVQRLFRSYLMDGNPFTGRCMPIPW